jgi:hypothetical protein
MCGGLGKGGNYYGGHGGRGKKRVEAELDEDPHPSITGVIASLSRWGSGEEAKKAQERGS